MRYNLILSFILVVLVSIIGVVVLARIGAATEVRTFVQTGGQQYISNAAAELEKYYAAQGSWIGAEKLFENLEGQGAGRGGQGGGQGNSMGGMNQGLILTDADRKVIAVSAGVDIGIGEFLSETAISNGITLDVSVKGTNQKQLVGYLLSYGALRFTAAEETFLVERLSSAAILAGALAGIVAILLGFYLTYRLLLPVRQLTEAAHGLAAGDLSRRVPVSGSAVKGDELAQLASTFNVMADSLQTAQSTRKAMTADIAHELRTPLSVQRATLEALQDGIYPLNTDSLIPLLEQNHLLSRLVEDLRTLALSDSGKLHLERIPTNLVDFVQRLLARFQAAADAGQITLLSSLPGPDSSCVANVDPLRIEQVLNNLLSNALRHTPPQGQIMIKLEPGLARHAWVIQISDSGPGIPEEALPHIFERFYRADKSRSRQEGGSGLGLTIARDLMRAHGGDLTAANLPNGGALFSILIPKG